MTDNEIIKALECCTGQLDEGLDCTVCPFMNTDNCMRNELLALDLIKRQKAEIERLNKENRILSENADTAFQDGLNEAQDLYREQVKSEVSAEAIKEFAERLKAEVGCFGKHITDGDIDSFVKEMVGDNNG